MRGCEQALEGMGGVMGKRVGTGGRGLLFFGALLQIGNFSYSLPEYPGENCPEGNFSRLCGMDAAPAGGPDRLPKPTAGC